MVIEYITPGTAGDGYLFSMYPDGTGSAELQVSPTQTIWHYQPLTSTFAEMVSLFPSTFMQVASTPGMILSQNVPSLGVVNFAAFSGGENPVSESLTSDQKFRIRQASADAMQKVQTKGSVMRSLQGFTPNYEPFSPAIGSSSLAVEGAISTGRMYERKKLNSILLGAPRNSLGGLLPGTTPFPSPTVMDALPNLGSPTASIDIPSWTRAYMGSNQAFVINALTSTMHEQRVLNAFVSGTETLESTAAPVTISLNFSKESRLQRIVVKKTASATDAIFRSGSWVPQTFFPGTGSLFSTVTGSGNPDLTSGGHSNQDGITETSPQPAVPASILIPVNVSGRLVDIKVWLEVIAVSGSGRNPLGSFAAAIRSPNVTWGNAHPIRNDPQLRRIYTSDTNDFSITAHTIDRGNYATLSGTLNDFYRDTFILWEGPTTFCDFGDTSSVVDSGAYARLYPCWHSDRGMRTVFSDGAACANPRHLNGPRGQNYVGSPSSAQGFTSAYGAQVPWTSDATVPVGSAAYQAAGSPPKGWLNGPGGTADVNEWPTTGVNYGTNEIRPLYPLLDGIFQTKVTTDEVPPQTSSLTQALYQPSLWRGFRPGLRGSEISGTWELLLVTNFVPTTSYFRQVRLEITYETPPSSVISLHRNRRRKNPGRAGSYRITRISGSDSAVVGVGLQRSSWDFGFSDNFVVVDPENEIGATFGVTRLTGNFSNETALLYRLTGSLADVVGEAAPDWLFTGPLGMPNIPESSATLSPRVPEPIVSFPFNSFLQPRRTLDGPQRLEDVSSDLNPPQSLRDLAAAFVSSSAT